MSALDTFRRTMRRHERRARRTAWTVAFTLRMVRVEDGPLRNVDWLRESESLWRTIGNTPDRHGRRLTRTDRRHGRTAARQWAWLYGRAADAVARLNADGGAS